MKQSVDVTTDQRRPTSTTYARYVLAVMVGINLLNTMDRYVLPSVASKVQSEFHLTDSQIGVLGSAFFVVFAVAVIPFGVWADRGVRKTVIGAGVTIWSVATLVTGLARNYFQLFAARAFLGIGEASYYPAGTSLLGDYFPKEVRGRVMSIWFAGTALGIAAGFVGGGIVASHLGWRAAFYLTAIPGLIFALLAFGLREPLRGEAEHRGPRTGAAREITLRTTLGLLRIPTLRATIAAETAVFFALGGGSFWLPTLLSRHFRLGTDAAGTVAGGVLVLALLTGSLLGGVLSDRLTKRRQHASNLPVGMAGFVVGTVFVTLALLAPSLSLFIPMFFVGAAAVYLYQGPYVAVKQNVVVPTLRASAVTIALLVEHLLGDSSAPLVIGKVSDTVHSLQLALLILVPPVLVLATVFAALGLRHEDPDGQTMERQWITQSECGAPERVPAATAS